MGTDVTSHDAWSSGDSYERYVGRWSRLVANEFIRWLAVPENRQWLDVGSGKACHPGSYSSARCPSAKLISTQLRALSHAR